MNYLARDPMIKIDFQEPDTENWRKWQAKCKAEQEKHNKAIEQKQPSKVKGDVYKGKRYKIKQDIYMNLHGPFHGKCAYCESLIAENQPGDIEHFRPKNAVKDINNKVVMVHLGDDLKPHSGYYWLAYCWRNLLPSCRDCNSTPKVEKDVLIGKGNRFPLDNADYATKPGEEKREKPLLINPVYEDPEEHLEVDEMGIMKEKNGSKKGKTCIDVFGLNVREALYERRKRVYNHTTDLVGLVFFSVMNDYPDAQDRLKEFWNIWEGKAPFSAAGRSAINKRLPPQALGLLLQLYEQLTLNE